MCHPYGTQNYDCPHLHFIIANHRPFNLCCCAGALADTAAEPKTLEAQHGQCDQEPALPDHYQEHGGSRKKWESCKLGSEKEKAHKPKKSIRTQSENYCFKNKLTVEDPHNKYTIEDQSCSWTTPLKNCLSAVFKLGFNKSYILEIRHLKSSRRMELRK
jgi:hypothetical protein